DGLHEYCKEAFGIKAAALPALFVFWLFSCVCAGVVFAQDSMTTSFVYPLNGAVSVDRTQPIQWTGVANAEAYYLYVGTAVGAKDLIDTGEIPGTTHLVMKSLPVGRALYARVYTKVRGVWRASGDISFTVGGAITASFVCPLNGAVGVDPTRPIQWTSVANAEADYLYVGTAVGAKGVVDMGEITGT